MFDEVKSKMVQIVREAEQKVPSAILGTVYSRRIGSLMVFSDEDAMDTYSKYVRPLENYGTFEQDGVTVHWAQ